MIGSYIFKVHRDTGEQRRYRSSKALRFINVHRWSCQDQWAVATAPADRHRRLTNLIIDIMVSSDHAQRWKTAIASLFLPLGRSFTMKQDTRIGSQDNSVVMKLVVMKRTDAQSKGSATP